jgi:uncharacterized damage-inducible protein DinB
MHMHQNTLTLALALSITTGSFVAKAQSPADASTPPLTRAFRTIADDLTAAAEKMTADNYGFRPVDGVRSFGQVVAHVAGGHFLYCSQAAGSRLSPEVARRLHEVRPFSDVETESGARTFNKSELVALLTESIEYCDTVYARMAGGGAAPLIENIAHDNEHYGNLVTYMRLKGLVPPSTERRARKSP